MPEKSDLDEMECPRCDAQISRVTARKLRTASSKQVVTFWVCLECEGALGSTWVTDTE